MSTAAPDKTARKTQNTHEQQMPSNQTFTSCAPVVLQMKVLASPEPIKKHPKAKYPK